MSEDNKEIKNRIEKIKDWFKDPYNLGIFLIMLAALAIRIYYWDYTAGQTIWWDEGEYMSAAKHWIYDIDYELNPQRPPLFQALAALIMLAGIGEQIMKLLLVVIPSTFLVYCIYLLGKEMFDKKIGLIAALLSSVSWTFVFWSARIQPDFFSMAFQVLAVFFMWKHWKNENLRFVLLSGFFAALGFYFKVSALLVPMIFIVFIFMKEGLSAIKNKYNYYFSLAFLATLLPYFIWSFINFGNPFAFRKGYVDAPTDFPIGWYNIKFYYILTEGIVFALFIFGVLLALKFLLYSDILIKDRKKFFDANIFSILALVFISLFYIFYMRNTDDRWVFLWMPFIFFLTGKASMFIYNYLKKYNKGFSILIIIAILGFAAYSQMNHADSLIEVKKDSYAPVKSAGLLIGEVSEPGDLVLTQSHTQTIYYSNRACEAISYYQNETSFIKALKEKKPRFVEFSLFEYHPSWAIRQGNQGNMEYIHLPITNSTIVTQQGKILALDLKPETEIEGIRFKLIYPSQNIDGMFAYELEY